MDSISSIDDIIIPVFLSLINTGINGLLTIVWANRFMLHDFSLGAY